MTKLTLALCAISTLLFSACSSTNTLYTHRKDFSPNGHGGAWQTEYERLYRGTKRAEQEALQGSNARRPLWRAGKWHEYHWSR